MASRTIITDFVRASYVHLAEAFSHDPKQDAKFQMAMMASQHGVVEVPNVGQLTSSFTNILAALDEVCAEEWGCDFEGAKGFVTYPPEFRDGNKGKPKKENGRPVPGQFETNPAEHDMFILSAKSLVQPGTVGPDGMDVDPSAVYSGAWVRCQLEISAFMASNDSPILKIELLNVQYCYDDESLGGRTPTQAASSAFAGMAITNTNVKAGTGQTMRPVAPNAPGKPAAPNAPGKPAAPNAPGKPAAPNAPQMQTVKELVALTDYTIEQLRTEFQYSDDQIVAEGFGEWQEKQVPVSKPVAPTAPTAPVKPAAPTAPVKPAAPTAPVKPAAPTVIMNDDSEYTYEQLTGEFGWTDAQIVEGGYGQFNYLDPQA